MIRALLAFSLFFAGSAQAVRPEAPKFLLWPPDGWDIQAGSDFDMYAVSRNPGEDGASVKVTQVFATPGETLDKYMAADRRQHGKNWTVKKTTNYSYQGIEGKMLDIEEKDGKTKNRLKKLYIFEPPRFFSITCGSTAAAFPVIEAKCAKAITTFNFKP